MTNAQRLAALATTRKQREFDHDFLASWEGCITWEDAPIGQPAVLPGEFVVEEEDVLAYNRALGETDPLFIDPATLVNMPRAARSWCTPSSSPPSPSG